MSKCISSHGEYSEHVPGEGPERFHCQLCFVFDEDAALDRIAKLDARLRRNEVIVSVDDKAIMGAVKQHLADFKAQLEAAKGGPLRILPAELATNGEFVLTWHPIDDDGDPVEIPFGEPWLLPGTDVKVGEFRLSTREVPDAEEAPGEVDAALLADLLSLVGVIVSEKQAEGWTEEQRQQAARWAGAVHLSASDNDDVEVPPRPAFLDEVSGG